MSISPRQRQWDIYKANLGEGQDCFLLILSSNETNEILESQIIGCEVVPESLEKIATSPITLKARPEETGLPENVTMSVATLASIPRNCLVSLEGRLESISLRIAVHKGVRILIGAEPWP